MAALPITEWNYKTLTGARHLGPVAQDFRAAFGLGTDDKGISTVDADGENMHLARLGPGDVVSEISLVLRKPATAHAVASHPTVALELTREAFDGAIASHPALLGQLYQLAVSRDDQTRSVMAQATMEAGDFDVIV